MSPIDLVRSGAVRGARAPLNSQNPRWLAAAVAALLASTAQATITGEYSAGVLTVTSDADDFIALSAADADSPVQGLGPTGPSVLARDVTRIRVLGGPVANLITLQAVSNTNFPNLTVVEIDGGGGADQIFGSAVRDEITDNDGGDSLSGDAGSNVFTIRLDVGTNSSEIIGGAGKLVVVASTGDDAVTVLSNRAIVNGRTVSFSAGVNDVAIRGEAGNDTIETPAFTGVTLNVDGGDGFDVLNFDAQGSSASDSGFVVLVAGRAPLNYSTIEDLNLLNLPSTGSGNSNSNTNSSSDTNSNSGATNDNGAAPQDNANTSGAANSNSADGSDNGGQTSDDGSGDAPLGDVLTGAQCGACGAGFAPLMPFAVFGVWAAKRGRSRRSRD